MLPAIQGKLSRLTHLDLNGRERQKDIAGAYTPITKANAKRSGYTLVEMKEGTFQALH